MSADLVKLELAGCAIAIGILLAAIVAIAAAVWWLFEQIPHF